MLWCHIRLNRRQVKSFIPVHHRTGRSSRSIHNLPTVSHCKQAGIIRYLVKNFFLTWLNVVGAKLVGAIVPDRS